MSRYRGALARAISQYNERDDAGEPTGEATQTVIMMALLYQNELLEELVGRTTPL